MGLGKRQTGSSTVTVTFVALDSMLHFFTQSSENETKTHPAAVASRVLCSRGDLEAILRPVLLEVTLQPRASPARRLPTQQCTPPQARCPLRNDLYLCPPS